MMTLAAIATAAVFATAAHAAALLVLLPLCREPARAAGLPSHAESPSSPRAALRDTLAKMVLLRGALPSREWDMLYVVELDRPCVVLNAQDYFYDWRPSMDGPGKHLGWCKIWSCHVGRAFEVPVKGSGSTVAWERQRQETLHLKA